MDDTEEICREIIEKNPKHVELYRRGGTALGFLIGQVIKESGGSCEPKAVSDTLKRIIAELDNKVS